MIHMRNIFMVIREQTYSGHERGEGLTQAYS